MGGVFGKDKATKGERRPCTEQIHSGKVQSCGSKNCQAMLCLNCTQPHPSDNKLYCMLCAMSKQADEMPLDQEALRKSKIKGASSQFSVKMDMDTGEITGFDKFLAQLDRKEQTHASKGFGEL